MMTASCDLKFKVCQTFHQKRRDLELTFGIGTKDTPASMKKQLYLPYLTVVPAEHRTGEWGAHGSRSGP